MVEVVKVMIEFQSRYPTAAMFALLPENVHPEKEI